MKVKKIPRWILYPLTTCAIALSLLGMCTDLFVYAVLLMWVYNNIIDEVRG